MKKQAIVTYEAAAERCSLRLAFHNFQNITRDIWCRKTHVKYLNTCKVVLCIYNDGIWCIYNNGIWYIYIPYIYTIYIPYIYIIIVFEIYIYIYWWYFRLLVCSLHKCSFVDVLIPFLCTYSTGMCFDDLFRWMYFLLLIVLYPQDTLA